MLKIIYEMFSMVLVTGTTIGGTAPALLTMQLSKDDPFEMFSNVKFQTQSKRKHLLKYMLKLKQKTQL